MRRRSFLAASALSVPLVSTATANATPRLSTGAEQLAHDEWRKLKGRKVGVLTNPTGILSDQTHIVDSMVAHDAKPTAVFGPEHGFRCTAQAGGSEGDYAYATGVGLKPIVQQHGMTVGELARFFEGEFDLTTKPEVVNVRNWRR